MVFLVKSPSITAPPPAADRWPFARTRCSSRGAPATGPGPPRGSGACRLPVEFGEKSPVDVEKVELPIRKKAVKFLGGKTFSGCFFLFHAFRFGKAILFFRHAQIINWEKSQKHHQNHGEKRLILRKGKGKRFSVLWVKCFKSGTPAGSFTSRRSLVKLLLRCQFGHLNTMDAV